MTRDLRLPAADGFPLAATLHEPPALPDRAAPRSLVIVAPATAVPRGYYAGFASFLAARGHLVLAYDPRGMGGSAPGPRGARMSDWGTLDLAGALAWAAKERPAAPRLVVGHSAGAQLLGLAEGADRLAGALSVAAGTGWWGNWRGAMRARRWLDVNVSIPLVATLLGKLPRWALGEPLPGGIAREWARWCRSAQYLLRDDADERRARYARVRIPYAFWGFTDDAYAPPAAVDALARLYPEARVERRSIAPAEVGAARIGHFGFFRREFETALWGEAAAWLEARP